MPLFDNLLPVEKRVELALRRQLQSRLGVERTNPRWTSHHYKGAADLLLQHGRFRVGRELPANYAHLKGAPQECFTNALVACQADTSLRYCEGLWTSGWGSGVLHAWCVDPDERVLEVTMPTEPDIISRGRNRIGMFQLPPEHWGYWGVIWDTDLMQAHIDWNSLPTMDRSNAELFEGKRDYSQIDASEPHDFPLLKVPYNRYRKSMP